MSFGISAGTAALVGGGLSLAGAVYGANASKDAANTQAQSADNATNLQRDIYGQNTQNLAPWLNAGRTNLSQLNAFMGTPGYETGASITPGAPQDNTFFGAGVKPFSLADFKESPAYQFNLSRGMDAINKASASRGNYFAPQTLQDVAKFSQGLASNEFNNAYSMYNNDRSNIYNRLAGQSGTGQNAAVQQGQSGTAFGNAAANNMIGAGNAQAAGIVGGANALNSGIAGANNNYWMGQVLGQNQAGTYGNGNPYPRNYSTDTSQDVPYGG